MGAVPFSAVDGLERGVRFRSVSYLKEALCVYASFPICSATDGLVMSNG